MTNEEIRELFEQKVRRRIFAPVERFVTGSDREERVAEAIAMTFELFARRARAGVLLDDAVLVLHCRLRVVDLGRHLVKGGQRLRDAMDPRNYHRGRLELLRIDGLPDQDGDFGSEEDGNVVIGLAEGLSQDPTPAILSAIDLERWAATLREDDRAVLAARYAGNSLAETGAIVGCSTSAAFARLRRLGAELAQRAGVTIRRKPRKRRASAVAGRAVACFA